MQQSENKYIYILLFLAIKILYILLNILMLPKEWVGFDFNRDIHLQNLVVEIPILLICIFIFIRYFSRGNSLSFVAAIFFSLYVIPSNSVMSLSNYDFIYFISINFFNILMLVTLGKIASKNMSIINEQDFHSSFDINETLQKKLRRISIFTCFGVIVYVYFLRGTISLDGIFVGDIYDKRTYIADLYIQNTDNAIAYLMTIWTAFYTSMLIIGLYIALKKRHFGDIALFVYTYLVLFSFDMQKSTLIKPIIAVFVYFLYKKDRLEKSSQLFLKGYAALLIISGIEYYFYKESFLYTLIVRRMTYMPQYLSHAYYNFFSSHSNMWLTHDFFQLEKIVRLIYSGDYEHGVVAVIAENCFPGVPSPNTGLFAEAYSQLSYLGIIIFPIIFSFVIWMYYKYSVVFGKGAPFVLLSSLLLSLINIQLLAPRGILVVLIFILISYLVKRNSKPSVK